MTSSDVNIASGSPAIPPSDLSIVIPCFNEEATIGEVLDQLARRFPEAELLVVDDGSTDGTAQRAGGRPQRAAFAARSKIAATGPRSARPARRPRDLTWSGSTPTASTGPTWWPRCSPGCRMCDCVIGARTGKSPAPWFRRCGVAAICWLARLLTLRYIPDLNCGLRAFRLDLLRRYLHLLPEGFSASATTTIVMLECGHRVAWTPIPSLARSGSSRLRLLRDGAGTLLLVVRLVVLLSPWKIFLPLAAGLSLLGLLAGIGWRMLGGRFSLLAAGLAARQRSGRVVGHRGPSPQPAVAAAAGSVATRPSRPTAACRSPAGLPRRNRIANRQRERRGPLQFLAGHEPAEHRRPQEFYRSQRRHRSMSARQSAACSRPDHLGDFQTDRVFLPGLGAFGTKNQFGPIAVGPGTVFLGRIPPGRQEPLGMALLAQQFLGVPRAAAAVRKASRPRRLM